MSYNTLSGAVPLNLRKDPARVEKALSAGRFADTSWQPGIRHPKTLRMPQLEKYQRERNLGAPALRRHANGRLDMMDAVHRVLDSMHLLQMGGVLNGMQMGLLSLLFPDEIKLVDPNIAAVSLKLSPQEKMMIKMLVAKQVAAAQNWRAGQGGGWVPGAPMILRSMADKAFGAHARIGRMGMPAKLAKPVEKDDDDDDEEPQRKLKPLPKGEGTQAESKKTSPSAPSRSQQEAYLSQHPQKRKPPVTEGIRKWGTGASGASARGKKMNVGPSQSPTGGPVRVWPRTGPPKPTPVKRQQPRAPHQMTEKERERDWATTKRQEFQEVQRQRTRGGRIGGERAPAMRPSGGTERLIRPEKDPVAAARLEQRKRELAKKTEAEGKSLRPIPEAQEERVVGGKRGMATRVASAEKERRMAFTGPEEQRKKALMRSMVALEALARVA